MTQARVNRLVWARARDYYSDRPFGRRSHAWVENRMWPVCGEKYVSVDATLKDGPRCKRCEAALEEAGRQ